MPRPCLPPPFPIPRKWGLGLVQVSKQPTCDQKCFKRMLLFPPVILGPEMASPLLRAPGTFCSFCFRTSIPKQFLVLGVVGVLLGFLGGGGEARETGTIWQIGVLTAERSKFYHKEKRFPGISYYVFSKLAFWRGNRARFRVWGVSGG